MSNQIAAALFKIASFLDIQQSIPTTMTDQTVQQVDPIEQREAIEREQARMSQEIEQCQCIYQKINGLLDALLAEREHIEGKVETLYMKLYCCIHGTIDGNDDDVSQEKYQGINEVYTQLGHQKFKLERRLAEIDEEIERLDVEKGEISGRKEMLLEEQLGLGLRKESLDERKRSVEPEMPNK